MWLCSGRAGMPCTTRQEKSRPKRYRPCSTKTYSRSGNRPGRPRPACSGRKGKDNNGIYQVSVPRAEAIKEGGMEVPPSMGVATAINFQPTGAGKAAITGDFVLIAGEVNPVITARPLPVRLQERTCWQALYQASPPPSSAQEKRVRGRSICGSVGLERFWSGF